MKHYFQPSNIVNWASIQIRSPVAGTVSRLDQEQLAGSGTQIRIKSRDFPAFYFILFHVQTNSPISVGDSVSAGQLLGTHIGSTDHVRYRRGCEYAHGLEAGFLFRRYD